MWGYDAWGHVAYVFYLDLYRAVPWADQGWSYFHPPLHYLIGWALTQARSGELLMRGLALWGSLASLLTAYLAARLAWAGFPERPGLALIAFGAVACLPVHYYMSPMPGNEMTATLLGAAALTSFIQGESAERPSRGRDALTGIWLGLGLLTKFSGLVTLVALLAALIVRAAQESVPAAALRRAAVRGIGIAALALAIAAPYYARNLAAFGTPFELSRGYPLVAEVERGQPPGSRSWRDFASFSPSIFSDPNPLAPHMYRSVWGSAYLNVWADLYRESDVARALEAEREERRSTRALALLGLLPSGLALAGCWLALRDLARGRRRALWTASLLLSAATLGSFGLFAWRVPIWSALKASYLLGLSLPFALFLCRALEELLERGRRRACAVLSAGLAAVALAASGVAVDGLVLPRRADAPATGAVRFYFGEYEAARSVYRRLITGATYPVPWLDNLAAVELADGHPDRARLHYARALMLERARGRPDPYRQNQLAVAMALAGDLADARSLLDDVLERTRLPELLANRGALHAVQGDEGHASVDLLDAIALAPELAVARFNLGRELEREGRMREAQAAGWRRRRPPASRRAASPTASAPARCWNGGWAGAGCCCSRTAGSRRPCRSSFARPAPGSRKRPARPPRPAPGERPLAPAPREPAGRRAGRRAAAAAARRGRCDRCPLFVAVARQIVEAPADPFGFQMIWDPTSPDTARFNRNPPLLSYWLAAWIALFGERETVMHAALLPFPVIAVLSFLGLARRLAGRGVEPALLLVATPAFGVLASTLLLDLPVLAGWLLAAYALLRGAESGSPGWLLAAGVAGALAGLTKYVGFATAPLLAAGVWLLCRRRGSGLLCVLAPPLLAWSAWGAYTYSRYGFVHFLGSTDVVTGRSFEPRELWNQLASVPVFTAPRSSSRSGGRRERWPGASAGRLACCSACCSARGRSPGCCRRGSRRGARRSGSMMPCSVPSPSREPSGCGRVSSSPRAGPPPRRIASCCSGWRGCWSSPPS